MKMSDGTLLTFLRIFRRHGMRTNPLLRRFRAQVSAAADAGSEGGKTGGAVGPVGKS